MTVVAARTPCSRRALTRCLPLKSACRPRTTPSQRRRRKILCNNHAHPATPTSHHRMSPRADYAHPAAAKASI